MPATSKSRARIASSPSNTIPIATRGTRTRRRSSRRPPRPTRFSRTATSARATTDSAMPACRRRPAAASIRPHSPASRTSSAASSAISSAAAAAAGRSAAATCATTSRSPSRNRPRASRPAIEIPRLEVVRDLPRLRRRAGQQPDHVPAVPGPRAAALPAGVLHGGAHVRPMPGHRPRHHEAVHRRARAKGARRSERKLTVKIPAGIADGQRLRISGEGEGGMAGGPPGDLYVFIEVAAASVFPPRRQQPVVRDSAELHDARAGRQHRRADARRARVVQGARRHAVGHRSSGCAAKACRTCRAEAEATCSSPCRP